MRKKNTSKRTKLKTKYFNVKKRGDRKRKLKKDKKLNPNKYHKRKADLGVPNSCPFKEDILNERQQILNQKAEIEKQKTLNINRARQRLKAATVNVKRNLPVESFTFESPEDESNIDPMELTDQQNEQAELSKRVHQSKILSERARKQKELWEATLAKGRNLPDAPPPDARYPIPKTQHVNYTAVRKVVIGSDVILQVLDARDPEGTRCSELEAMVRSEGRRLVLVLNKADLVPRSNLQRWLNHLRRSLPTVAFKAAVQHNGRLTKGFQRMKHLGEEALRTPYSMGGQVLLELMKNYARSSKMGALRVGVVGFPNTGKSSLINSLKRMKSCEVSSTAGSTKTLREVKLDSKLYLVDSPGVVFPSKDMDEVTASLKNVVNVSEITDPVAVAQEIYRRCNTTKLCIFYNLHNCEGFDAFILAMSRNIKRVKVSGIRDIDETSRKLVSDWNHGILKYYSEPPARASAPVSGLALVEGDPSGGVMSDPVIVEAEELFFRSKEEVTPGASHVLKTTEHLQCNEMGLVEEDESEIDESDEENESMDDEEEDMDNGGSENE